MTKRFFIFLLLSCLFVLPSFALSHSSYSDLASTSSYAVNLLDYAWSLDGFADSEFVIYRSDQYDYYLVFGDLSFSGQSITGSDVEYVRYYRESSSGYNSSYLYDYGTADTFSLDIVYAVTTNIPTAGFTSSDYEELKFYRDFQYFIIFIVSMIFVIMLKSLRR